MLKMMKKIFVMGILTAFAITTGSAISAQAADLTVTGFAQALTYLLGNYRINAPSNPVADKGSGYTSSFIDERMHIYLDMRATKDIGAVLKLELDSTNWGDNQAATDEQRNKVGRLNADRAGLEIKNAYIDANLPNIPVNLKVGVYGFYNRPHVFQYTDAAGVNVTIKADPVTITPFYYKGYEGAYDKQDDNDYYGLMLDHTGKALKVGAYGLYLRMGDFNAATRPTFSYPYKGSYTDFNVTQSGDFYWAGVYADGGVGNFLFRFDAIYNGGKLKDKTTPTSQDVDYQGWMLYGKAWLDFKQYEIGLVGMYSTGDDLNDTTKVKGFRLPPGSESYAVFGEGLIFYPSPLNSVNGYIAMDFGAYNYQPYRGYGGTYLAKAYATINPTKWLSLRGQYSYIGDTVKNGNRFGSASDKDVIGQEIDLFGKFTIAKNLTYDVGLGYLFAGDALKKNNATEPENPWAVITKLTVTF